MLLSVTYQLLQLSHTDHCTETDSYTHTQTHTLKVCVLADTLTHWDQGANVHTWSHTSCIDEQTYAHTHINPSWVSDLTDTHTHTGSVVDRLTHTHTHPEGQQR